MANPELEKQLEVLPDVVADRLLTWRTATFKREKHEAILYAKLKGEDAKRTADEIKALIRSEHLRCDLVLAEIKEEAEYTRYNERLMSFKRLAALRGAF